MKRCKVLVLAGPTASGKTAAAVALAKELDGEIISADSMQIYRRMTIGTAKPSLEEMQGIPHHLIDCVEPDAPFSVAAFVAQAQELIAEIDSRGRVPIVAGGTGLYINGLTLPWSFEAPDRDEALREELMRRARTEGPQVLYDELKQVDPESAEGLHPNNVKRVVRALEIFGVTGRPKSEIDKRGWEEPLPFDYIMTGILWPREELYQRIDRRVDVMVAEGLMDEVRALLDAGYSENLPAMKAIGYKECFPYLRGEETLEETIRVLKRDTRHFAKRQLTWFRRDERITWFDYSACGSAEALAQAVAAYYRGQLKGQNE
jgi:tRNA dimethylallyltransferase